ncbi:hypothetical protein MUO79_02820 [Candidatus Bathyarchaeota archaeon]|nr:hypothetical protein [Candidatus Bathyarchaeota archaeon]
MSELPSPRNGPIEGTSRVLRELLRTPNFKKTVKILLNELDPENAGLLVRTAFWEDPEFFISLLGATPSLVNSMIEGTREFSTQMFSFPPRLLAGFMRGIIDDIDAESIGETAGNLLVLLSRTAGPQGDELGDARTRFWEGLGKGFKRSLGDGAETASFVESLAGSIRAFARENPELMKNVVTPLVQAGRDALAVVEESKDES